MKEHFDRLMKALIAERDFELETYRSLLQNQPMKERVSEGVTLYPLDYIDQHYTPFENLQLQFRINPDQSGRLFGTNGKCQIFRALHTDKIDAILVKKNDQSLTVQLIEDETPDWLTQGKIGLNAICDTRTYDIQIQTLERLKSSESGLVFDFYHQKLKGYPSKDFQEDLTLNPSQNKAVEAILSDFPVTVVHGPPGTGKTKTLVAAISQLLRLDKRVLVATPTNAAADHVAHELHIAGHPVLRYGNSFKIDSRIEFLTLNSKIQSHPDLQVVARLKKDAEAIRKKAFRFIRNFGPAEQAERKALKQELRMIRKDIREIEDRIRSYSLEKSTVICGTIIGLQSEELNRQHFDVVMIDEAGQALEPAIWSIAHSHQKLVMAGDPFQLPPTLFSSEAQKSELVVSLIERAMKLNYTTELLNVQYRMHDLIMQFSNQKFYEGKLTSDKVAGSATLTDESFLPIEFIDTAGCGFEEKTNDIGGISNPDEADILYQRLVQIHSEANDIGIISPYRDQVNVLKSKIKDDGITIQTIDSFQGQERAIILISLVRSNENQQIGFLSDHRRINVAMTRAKRKLILIGDSATLGSDPFYLDLLTYVENHGSYRSAYEFIS